MAAPTDVELVGKALEARNERLRIAMEARHTAELELKRKELEDDPRNWRTCKLSIGGLRAYLHRYMNQALKENTDYMRVAMGSEDGNHVLYFLFKDMNDAICNQRTPTRARIEDLPPAVCKLIDEEKSMGRWSDVLSASFEDDRSCFGSSRPIVAWCSYRPVVAWLAREEIGAVYFGPAIMRPGLVASQLDTDPDQTARTTKRARSAQ